MGGAGDPVHRHHHHYRRKVKTQAEAGAEERGPAAIGCQSHESASIMGFCKKCCNYACEECYESGEHVQHLHEVQPVLFYIKEMLSILTERAALFQREFATLEYDRRFPRKTVRRDIIDFFDGIHEVVESYKQTVFDKYLSLIHI